MGLFADLYSYFPTLTSLPGLFLVILVVYVVGMSFAYLVSPIISETLNFDRVLLSDHKREALKQQRFNKKVKKLLGKST